MRLRFVHTGDFHLGHGFDYLPPSKADARRADLRMAFFHAAREARRWGAHLLLLSGDLFDAPHASERDLEIVVKNLRALAKAGIRCFAIPGNHDPALPGSVWERSELREALHLFTEDPAHGLGRVDLPEWDLTLAGIPWDPNDAMRPPLRDLLPGELSLLGRSILLLHGSEARLADEHPAFAEHPFRAEDLRGLPFGYVALGHYHLPSEVATWNGSAACYSGSPEGIRFSHHNEGLRSIVLGELDEAGRLSRLERCPVNARTVRVLRFTGDDGSTPDDWFRAADRLRDPNMLLRIVVPAVQGPARRRAEVFLAAIEHEFFYLDVVWEEPS